MNGRMNARESNSVRDFIPNILSDLVTPSRMGLNRFMGVTRKTHYVKSLRLSLKYAFKPEKL